MKQSDRHALEVIKRNGSLAVKVDHDAPGPLAVQLALLERIGYLRSERGGGDFPNQRWHVARFYITELGEQAVAGTGLRVITPSGYKYGKDAQAWLDEQHQYIAASLERDATPDTIQPTESETSMASKQLYDYAVILRVEDTDGDDASEVIVPPTTVLAASEEVVKMIATKAIPEENADDLEFCEVVVRPFR